MWHDLCIAIIVHDVEVFLPDRCRIVVNIAPRRSRLAHTLTFADSPTEARQDPSHFGRKGISQGRPAVKHELGGPEEVV